MTIDVRECAADEVEMLTARETPGADIARRQFARAQRGESIYLVAWVAGTPVGSGEVLLDEAHAGEVPELRNLHVEPAFQGRGAGTRVIAAAEAACLRLGFAALAVGVATDNPGARRLYERCGYEGTGELTTTTYTYVDRTGEHQATETDERLIKRLA